MAPGLRLITHMTDIFAILQFLPPTVRMDRPVSDMRRGGENYEELHETTSLCQICRVDVRCVESMSDVWRPNYEELRQPSLEDPAINLANHLRRPK